MTKDTPAAPADGLVEQIKKLEEACNEARLALAGMIDPERAINLLDCRPLECSSTIAAALASAEARAAELQRHVDLLSEKITGNSCGCAYDTPDDVCMHHSPMLSRAEARAEKAEKERDAARGAAGLGCDATDDGGGPHTLMKQGTYTFCTRCGETITAPTMRERARVAEARAAEAMSRVEELEAEGEKVAAEFEGDCWKAMRSLLTVCNFDWRDGDPDGVTADDAREFISETLDELEKGEQRWKARAQAAEARADRVKDFLRALTGGNGHG